MLERPRRRFAAGSSPSGPFCEASASTDARIDRLAAWPRQPELRAERLQPSTNHAPVPLLVAARLGLLSKGLLAAHRSAGRRVEPSLRPSGVDDSARGVERRALFCQRHELA